MQGYVLQYSAIQCIDCSRKQGHSMECNACWWIGMDGRKLESLDGAAGRQLTLGSHCPRLFNPLENHSALASQVVQRRDQHSQSISNFWLGLEPPSPCVETPIVCEISTSDQTLFKMRRDSTWGLVSWIQSLSGCKPWVFSRPAGICMRFAISAPTHQIGSSSMVLCFGHFPGNSFHRLMANARVEKMRPEIVFTM